MSVFHPTSNFVTKPEALGEYFCYVIGFNFVCVCVCVCESGMKCGQKVVEMQ